MMVVKAIFGSLVLSLGLVAYADRPGSQPPVEAGVQSCSSYVWECQYNCPFGGGQNILVATCDGIETVVADLPCSPDGCF
jgi:hypothetical protein